MTLTADASHECVLRHLTSPRFVNVKLVARLADARIGNADTSRVYVFIPDLHIVSNDFLPHYSYHFNEAENFYRMLFRIQSARGELLTRDTRLEVTQLGDLFDLWRDGRTASPDRIIADYQNLVKMLYAHPTGLNAQRIVGNHDVQMVGAPGWSLRAFYPNQDRAFAIALHGDWFDPFLTKFMPKPIQSLFVFLAGNTPFNEVATYPLATMLDVLRAESDAAGGFASSIRLSDPAPLGELKLAGSDHPQEVNVSRTSRKDAVHDFLGAVSDTVRACRGDPGALPAWRTIRLVVCGHTHHPRISVDDTNPDDPVFLMDCGAWIEKYDDGSGTSRDNCQIGVIAGNDLRIYQLDPG